MTGWLRLRESLWFVPTVLCVVAVITAETLVIFEGRFARLPLGPLDAFVYRVGSGGSRDLLGVIAGSVLSVAATSFSITLAVLALASSTYGPRLVRNFMADRGNQVVLGVYVATFLYSLLVLRSVRDAGEEPRSEAFVPHLAVNVAMLLAVLSVGVLVYFIHHISASVQVWTLARRVGDDVLATVATLYPDAGAEPPERAPVELPLGDGVPVRASRAGYVVAVDESGLVERASAHDAVVALRVQPGSFTVKHAVIARVWPAPSRHDADDALLAAVEGAVRLAEARTPHQDVEFAVQQLVEMATRALSPSMNDPYTAVNALDQVSVGLAELAARPLPSPDRFDSAGSHRLRVPGPSTHHLIELVFDAVRTYALEHPLVLQRAVDLAARVGERTHDPALRQHLASQLDLVLAAYQRADPLQHDLERLERRLTPTREALRSAV